MLKKEFVKSRQFVVATTTNDINAGYRFPKRQHFKVSVFDENFSNDVRYLRERTDKPLNVCWDDIVPFDPRFPTGWLRELLEELSQDMATYESKKVEITLTMKVL